LGTDRAHIHRRGHLGGAVARDGAEATATSEGTATRARRHQVRPLPRLPPRHAQSETTLRGVLELPAAGSDRRLFGRARGAGGSAGEMGAGTSGADERAGRWTVTIHRGRMFVGQDWASKYRSTCSSSLSADSKGAEIPPLRGTRRAAIATGGTRWPMTISRDRPVGTPAIGRLRDLQLVLAGGSAPHLLQSALAEGRLKGATSSPSHGRPCRDRPSAGERSLHSSRARWTPKGPLARFLLPLAGTTSPSRRPWSPTYSWGLVVRRGMRERQPHVVRLDLELRLQVPERQAPTFRRTAHGTGARPRWGRSRHVAHARTVRRLHLSPTTRGAGTSDRLAAR